MKAEELQDEECWEEKESEGTNGEDESPSLVFYSR
jgi:hypothetical protein